MKYSLSGEKILVTGVSRSHGIGRAIVKTLSEAGALVAAHGYGAYDQAMGYDDAHTASDPFGQPNVCSLPPSDLSAAGEAERAVEEAALSATLAAAPAVARASAAVATADAALSSAAAATSFTAVRPGVFSAKAFIDSSN